MGVNLNCIDVYAVMERANDRKLHLFATKHEANTYSEHLIHYDCDFCVIFILFRFLCVSCMQITEVYYTPIHNIPVRRVCAELIHLL